MIGLPPADRSRAVLIGCSTYRHLSDLPAVANNVTDLAAALAEPALWGLPPGNCLVVPDDAAVPEVITAVRRATQDVGEDGLLLIYYAGHGLIDSAGGRLHLAVTASEHGEEDATAVAYESVRRRVWQSRAAYKLVILDCCYAGRALLGEMSGAGLAEDVEIDQSVIIAATSRNLVALAPPGARHTAFTGELLTILNRGLADGPPVLDARTIWREILRTQIARGLPRPEFRSRNAAEDIPLVRNAWRPPVPTDDATAGRPVARPASPVPPSAEDPIRAGDGAAVRRRPPYRLLGVLGGVLAIGLVLLPKWWPAGRSDDLAGPPRASSPVSARGSAAPSAGPSLPDPAEVTAPSDGSCADQEMSVTPGASSTTVRRGSSLELTLSVKSISNRVCVRDVGPDAQEIYLEQGPRKTWSSDTCDTVKGSERHLFFPGYQRVYKVTWNGRRSNMCSGTTAAGPNPQPGIFELRARLGSLVSAPLTLTIVA